jgi:hypothetical protein
VARAAPAAQEGRAECHACNGTGQLPLSASGGATPYPLWRRGDRSTGPRRSGPRRNPLTRIRPLLPIQVSPCGVALVQRGNNALQPLFETGELSGHLCWRHSLPGANPDTYVLKSRLTAKPTDVRSDPRDPRSQDGASVPVAESVRGTPHRDLRRECLDHVMVLNETHLRRLLRDYLVYYHSARTHLSLGKDSPEPRPVERPDHGGIVEMPWSAASIIATAGWRREIRPARGVYRPRGSRRSAGQRGSPPSSSAWRLKLHPEHVGPRGVSFGAKARCS